MRVVLFATIGICNQYIFHYTLVLLCLCLGKVSNKKDITLQTLAGCCLSFSLVHTPQNV